MSAASSYRNALLANVDLRKERDRLEEALFECYRTAGADTDGARSVREMGAVDIASLAVVEVRQLRADYDEAIS